jgi:cytochrome c-type biogenesis protein
MASDPTLVFAFVAGLVSFLSPCILPVIPAFLAHMAGTNLDTDIDRRRLFTTALAFVSGFAVVFGILGVAINSFLASAGSQVLTVLSVVAGTVIVLFGLHLSQVIRFPALEREYGFGLDAFEGAGHLTSVLLGGAFAVGWTPCVGPILGSIFALASARPGSAFVLLTAYSVGIGTPFLLIGLFPTRVVDALKQHMDTVTRVRALFGYVMIVLGLLIMTQNLELVANVGLLNEVLL